MDDLDEHKLSLIENMARTEGRPEVFGDDAIRMIAEIRRLRNRVDYLEDHKRENGVIISNVNEAINRAGIHCALYFWEAIDRIAAERDSALRELAALRLRLEDK